MGGVLRVKQRPTSAQLSQRVLHRETPGRFEHLAYLRSANRGRTTLDCAHNGIKSEPECTFTRKERSGLSKISHLFSPRAQQLHGAASNRQCERVGCVIARPKLARVARVTDGISKTHSSPRTNIPLIFYPSYYGTGQKRVRYVRPHEKGVL